MQRITLILIAILLIPLQVYAVSGTQTDGPIILNIQTGTTTATITIDATRVPQAGVPTINGKIDLLQLPPISDIDNTKVVTPSVPPPTTQATSGSPTSTRSPLFRIAGIKIWNNSQLSGTPAYEKFDLRRRSQLAREDIYQTHSITGLTPNTTYYYKYYTFKDGFVPTAQPSTKTFSFRTDIPTIVPKQPFSVSATLQGTNLMLTIQGPAGDTATLAVIIRNDTVYAAGAMIPTSGTGTVINKTIGPLPATGITTTTINSINPTSPYYVHLVKMQNGKAVVLAATTYDGIVRVTPSVTSSFSFNNGNTKIAIATTDSTATLSITETITVDTAYNDLKIYKTKTNHSYSDKIFEQRLAFQKGTSSQDISLSSLSPGKTYYFVYGKSWGEFTTSKTAGETYAAAGYALSFSSEGGLTATYTNPQIPSGANLYLFLVAGASRGIGNDLTNPDTKTIDLGTPPAGTQTKIIKEELQKDALYYGILALRKSDKSFEYVTKPTETKLFYSWPLKYDFDDGKATISGTIDTAKHANFKDFSVKFERSTTPDFSEPLVYIPLSSIGTDGSFSFVMPNITPNAKYYGKFTITAPSGTTETRQYDFKGEDGLVVAGSRDAQKDFDSRSYRLLAPWPGLAVLLDPDLCAEQQAEGRANGAICDFNSFLQYIFKVLIGITAVLLVLKIMVIGYNYIVTDVIFLRVEMKQKLGEAVAGLLLALSSYVILNTINPKLVENKISLGLVEVGGKGKLSENLYYKLSGEKLKTTSQYITDAERIAKEEGIDACLLKATIQIESEWDPRNIGCDEDVRGNDVPSRKAFLGSGIKADGTKFTATTDVKTAIFNNSCKPDEKKPGYNLDWRFSKGGGLTQATVFPAGYDSASWYQDVKEGGKLWNARFTPASNWGALLKTDENLKHGAQELKDGLKACGGNIEQVFRRYQTGKCNGSGGTVNDTVGRKMSVYNDCKTK